MFNRIKALFVKNKRENLAKKKYNSDLKKYNEMITGGGIAVTAEWPILYDYLDSSAGALLYEYFTQDVLVAKRVNESGVTIHYDIGSRVDGFIGNILSNPKIESVVMIDIRPLKECIDKLSFKQADATNLDSIETGTISSLSSLHAVEHFGLGRYGDPIDPMACFKGMKAMQRVVSSGGTLYLGVPVSNVDECHFNAHRLLSPQTVVEQFDEMDLIEFIHISTKRKYDIYEGEDAIRVIVEKNGNVSANDTGIFVFRKR